MKEATLISKNGKPDRRVKRTRQLLREALFALILERGYDDITVQDILERADVGRSTFYTHFYDKDDLLLSGFAELRDMLTAQHDKLMSANPKQGEMAVSLLIFSHAEQHRQLYKALVGKRSGYLVFEEARKRLVEFMQEQLKRHLKFGEYEGIPVEVAVEFLTSSLMGLLIWWLDHDLPCSAAEINQMYYRLAVQNLPFRHSK
ncbi:MAG TPA: TetR/AcrR family transcriptional regulator [Chloroflexia bacterium]|nr:TetR/AcrR family transcriptional regulator [Chloroflexia bacterium]